VKIVKIARTEDIGPIECVACDNEFDAFNFVVLELFDGFSVALDLCDACLDKLKKHLAEDDVEKALASLNTPEAIEGFIEVLRFMKKHVENGVSPNLAFRLAIQDYLFEGLNKFGSGKTQKGGKGGGWK